MARTPPPQLPAEMEAFLAFKKAERNSPRTLDEYRSLLHRLAKANPSLAPDMLNVPPFRTSLSTDPADAGESRTSMKTKAQVQAAEAEFFQRRWIRVSYRLTGEDALAGRPIDPLVIQAQLDAVEGEHKDAILRDMEEHGKDSRECQYCNGKLDGIHQALRWMLDDDTDDRIEDASLDT